MKKKKLAFCLRDMQLGGVESVLVQLIDELARDKDLDVTLVTFVKLSEPIYQDWLKYNKNIKHVVLYPSRFLGTQMPHFFLWRLVKHLCRDFYRFIGREVWVKNKLKKFDTLIDFHDFGFVKEFKKVHDVKKIAWFHSSVNVFIRRKFVNYLKHYANVVILTNDCMHDLKKLYPEYSQKFIQIYNMLDIKKVKKLSSGKAPVDGNYFCCVSRMTGDKDIKTILDAFELFCRYHDDMNLVLIGAGDKLDEYKKYAASLKVANKIEFVGAQRNPYVYMANSCANILSSYGEGLPTVIIESQAVGVLNISSNCKYGPREILMDGDAGVLFTPGDSLELAKAMIDVYENNIDVKKMVQKSTKGLVRFDKDEIKEQVKSLIS